MLRLTVTKDTKALEMFKRRMQAQLGNELEVGFFSDARYGPENDNLQVAQVAQWNNEGSENNPPRPFFTSSIIAPIERKKYDRMFHASIDRIISGKSSFTQEYAVIGKALQNQIKQAIRNWDSPPNSPRTIAEKGFNNPLQDTDTMLNSVEYKITKKGSN